MKEKPYLAPYSDNPTIHEMMIHVNLTFKLNLLQDVGLM